MSNPAAGAEASFAREFLGHYLKNGMGSMSKTDIDALVMHLLDRYGDEGGRPPRSSQYLAKATIPRVKPPIPRCRRGHWVVFSVAQRKCWQGEQLAVAASNRTQR